MRWRCCLCQPIDIVDIGPGNLLEVFNNRWRHGRTATVYLLHRRKGALLDIWMVQERNEDCDRSHGEAAMPLLAQSKHLCRIKTIEHDDGHSSQRCHGKVGNEASDVEERCYAYHDVIFAELHPLPVDGRIKNNIGMGVYGTFRQPCRARCVGEKGDICSCKAGKLNRCSIKSREQLEHLKRLREAQLLRSCQESGKRSLTSIVEFTRGDNELHLRAFNGMAGNRFVQ